MGEANALVAADDERIVGCIVPSISTLAGEKIGIVNSLCFRCRWGEYLHLTTPETIGIYGLSSV